MSLPMLETLPEVAVARELLRSWYGLELMVVGAEHFGAALERSEPCRNLAPSLPSCGASWAAVGAEAHLLQWGKCTQLL